MAVSPAAERSDGGVGDGRRRCSGDNRANLSQLRTGAAALPYEANYGDRRHMQQGSRQQGMRGMGRAPSPLSGVAIDAREASVANSILAEYTAGSARGLSGGDIESSGSRPAGPPPPPVALPTIASGRMAPTLDSKASGYPPPISPYVEFAKWGMLDPPEDATCYEHFRDHVLEQLERPIVSIISLSYIFLVVLDGAFFFFLMVRLIAQHTRGSDAMRCDAMR